MEISNTWGKRNNFSWHAGKLVNDIRERATGHTRTDAGIAERVRPSLDFTSQFVGQLRSTEQLFPEELRDYSIAFEVWSLARQLNESRKNEHKLTADALAVIVKTERTLKNIRAAFTRANAPTPDGNESVLLPTTHKMQLIVTAVEKDGQWVAKIEKFMMDGEDAWTNQAWAQALLAEGTSKLAWATPATPEPSEDTLPVIGGRRNLIMDDDSGAADEVRQEVNSTSRFPSMPRPESRARLQPKRRQKPKPRS